MRRGREAAHRVARDGGIRRGAKLALDFLLCRDAVGEEASRGGRRGRRRGRRSRGEDEDRKQTEQKLHGVLSKGAASINPLPLRATAGTIKALKWGTGTVKCRADPPPDASEGRLGFDLAPNAVTRRPVRRAVSSPSRSAA